MSRLPFVGMGCCEDGGHWRQHKSGSTDSVTWANPVTWLRSPHICNRNNTSSPLGKLFAQHG